jgi:hypothetical protein
MPYAIMPCDEEALTFAKSAGMPVGRMGRRREFSGDRPGDGKGATGVAGFVSHGAVRHENWAPHTQDSADESWMPCIAPASFAHTHTDTSPPPSHTQALIASLHPCQKSLHATTATTQPPVLTNCGGPT